MKLLKPTLGYLRTGLPVLQHAPLQLVKRVTGDSARALKRRALARQGYLCTCEECTASGLPMALTWDNSELDHHLPLHLGGDNSIDNLRALHVQCHRRVTAQQAKERAASRSTWSDVLP